MKNAITARVIGHVQGVFFRVSAQIEANKLGITGWVKNTAYGDVYLEAQGDDKNLAQFIDWIHKGSKYAVVKQVILASVELREQYQSFDIHN